MLPRCLSALCLLCLGLVVWPAYAQHDPNNPPMPDFNTEGSDVRAIEIADAVMGAMGGREAWDNTRYLSWSFGSADQVWDKWDGRFRYQRGDLVVLMNVNTQEGQAWEQGQAVNNAESLKTLLDRAYFAWANSGYWFLMPYKLKDSKVMLTYLGEATTEDGRAAEKLGLTFGEIGHTPMNRYEVYVDKETMLVSQWSYYRNADDEEPGFTRPWRNWQRYGNIMLSDNRGAGSEGNEFILPNVGVYEELPESVFTDPARLDLATLKDL